MSQIIERLFCYCKSSPFVFHPPCHAFLHLRPRISGCPRLHVPSFIYLRLLLSSLVRPCPCRSFQSLLTLSHPLPFDLHHFSCIPVVPANSGRPSTIFTDTYQSLTVHIDFVTFFDLLQYKTGIAAIYTSSMIVVSRPHRSPPVFVLLHPPRTIPAGQQRSCQFSFVPNYPLRFTQVPSGILLSLTVSGDPLQSMQVPNSPV